MSADAVRIGDIVPLAASRARGMHASSPSGEPMHASGADDFDALVAAVGLRGPNRDLCRQAHADSPDGFQRVLVEALNRGRDPARFLVYLVKSGDHLDAGAVPVNRCGCSHPGCRFQDTCQEPDA